MAYSSIPDSWREVGKAIKKDLIDQIHENLEDLNGRVTNVEGSVSTTLIANQSFKKERDHAPIGTIVWSPLSEAQFQTATDDGGWELCDGASVAGSDYATLMSRSVVPDIRGRFIRMKDHGAGRNPTGEVDTDVSQTSENLAHTHTINHGHSHTIAASGTFASSTHRHNIAHVHIWGKSRYEATYGGSFHSMTTSDTSSIGSDIDSGFGSIPPAFSATGNYDPGSGNALELMDDDFDAPFPSGEATRTFYTTGVTSGPSGTGSSALSGTPSATSSVSNSGSVTSHSGSSGSQGLTESRPINVTENAFIKINKNYITVRDGYLLWRAPQAITINQVVVTPVTQGTSGTLTIDIKKGELGSISTSIFDDLPELAYNDTDPQTGTINATNAAIAAGEYVRLDITTTQAKLQEFHILIGAAPA